MDKEILERVQKNIASPADLKTYYEAIALAKAKPPRVTRFQRVSQLLASLDGIAKWLIGGAAAGIAVVTLLYGWQKDTLDILANSRNALVDVQKESDQKLADTQTKVKAANEKLTRYRAALEKARTEVAEAKAAAEKILASVRFFGTTWRTGEKFNGPETTGTQGMPFLQLLKHALPENRCSGASSPVNIRIVLADDNLFWQMVVRRGGPVLATCTGLGVWHLDNDHIELRLCENVLDAGVGCRGQPLAVLSATVESGSAAPRELVLETDVRGNKTETPFKRVIDKFW